ncbi:uncharacterized protein LOC129574191 isoform X2 [Sitodiplosis mosellana]|uniref:uncharacterized protein LOC129574191 isoform X2 n=1 Tax=Sitodiplosis mosellana TaxID=263140 RepID=UPI002444E1D2|nr:uncharacterized protein LOC129574191 isoform X2 [Sitodiplosis mosellana]
MKTNEVPVIRVKEFAKVEFLPSEQNGNKGIEENGTENSILPINIETISLSSEDEIRTVPNKPTKSIAQTPKPREKRLPRVSSAISKNRTPRLPSKYKYHKIDEYFSATKKDSKIGCATPISKQSTSAFSPESTKVNVEKKQEVTDAKRYASSLKQVKIVLRRLSIDQQVETSRKRKANDGQSKLPDFIEYEPTGDTYFTVHEHSTLPKQPLTELKAVECKVEENNVNSYDEMDNTTSNYLDYRPDYVYTDTSSIIKENEQNFKPQENAVNYNLRKKMQKTNKPTSVKATSKVKKEKKEKKEQTKIIKKSVPRKSRKVECPHYKIVEETTFAVDAFRYGDIEGVEHYFLTHFHADHYIGLKKSFNHTLYVSNITGRLVVEFIKVEEQYIRYLDINTPILVEDVEVTALDANHCPGAVLYLFKLKTGKCILHTGDFRASPDMEEYPEFWNNQIDTIYLDTTYLSSKYEFDTQSDSINTIVKYCQEFIKSSTSSSGKHLIICGSYKVGKEKVWLRIAQEFNYKVWIDNERHKAMQCLQNDEISDVLTRYAKDASVHVLPLGNISYQFIVEYMRQFGEAFCKVLAIRPSGWEKGKSKPNFANKISILGVQYSEHSNYSELERFVRFLQPKKVISTVPYGGKDLNKTPQIPQAWLNQKVEPKSKSYQRNIMDFMVKEPTVKYPTINQLKVPQKLEQLTAEEAHQVIDSISDDYLP